jgi:hypothetical protein
MARKKHTGKEHGTVIEVTAYTQKIDQANPWHVAMIIFGIVVLGIIGIFVLKMVMWLALILGAGYLLYLLVHKRR